MERVLFPKQRCSILLASASPRRYQLLIESGYTFVRIEQVEVTECHDMRFDARALVKINALRKMRATLQQIKKWLSSQNRAHDLENAYHYLASTYLPKDGTPLCAILTADTLVSLSDHLVLGKPKDYGEASQMLRQLQGRAHTVTTGVCLLGIAKQQGHYRLFRRLFVVTTQVYFKPLTLEAIHAYHENVYPLDKAGAYGAQERANEIIERTEGSWSNILGLPIEQLDAELQQMLRLLTSQT